MFSMFFIINLFVWGVGSSAAAPLTTMLALFALWFGISVPLCFFGAFMGAFISFYLCSFGRYPSSPCPTATHSRSKSIFLTITKFQSHLAVCTNTQQVTVLSPTSTLVVSTRCRVKFHRQNGT